MKSKITRLSALLLLVGSMATSAQDLTEEQAAQPIARVGDEVITAGEFARDMQFRVRQIESGTKQRFNPDLRFRRALLNEMVGNRILGIVAKNSGTVVTEEELEAEFQLRKQIFDSEEAYQSYLQRLNISEESLRDNVRSRLIVKNFVDKQTGDIDPSEEDVEKAYENLKLQGKMNRVEKTRDLAVILMRAKGGSDESWLAAEERAKAASARVKAGESFEAVAKEVSEDPATAPNGGVLHEIKVGSFYPELETAMTDLKPGEVSAPVRSLMGWYLVTILSENEPGTIPLASVKSELREQVIDVKRREKIAEIVADAQKLIRVEFIESPEAPAPESPESPDSPEAPTPAPETAPAIPAPS